MPGRVPKKVKKAKKTNSRSRSSAARSKKGPLERLRPLCLVFPEAEEFVSHGAPTFRVRGGRTFCMFADGVHYGRPSAWCKATPDNQALMIEAAPARFFRPPYVGPSGWVGVWLDGPCDWAELAALLEDGYRQVAPRRLLARAGK